MCEGSQCVSTIRQKDLKTKRRGLTKNSIRSNELIFTFAFIRKLSRFHKITNLLIPFRQHDIRTVNRAIKVSRGAGNKAKFQVLGIGRTQNAVHPGNVGLLSRHQVNWLEAGRNRKSEYKQRSQATPLFDLLNHNTSVIIWTIRLIQGDSSTFVHMQTKNKDNLLADIEH